ncbi:citrate/2-methylcitrate synthase, partial [Calditrichota bacterium]
NLNYYAAVLFHFLGIEAEMMPCFYAVGRMAGLVARVREYHNDNRLFRPTEKYIGKSERRYLSLDNR